MQNYLIFVVTDHKSKDGKIVYAEEVLRQRANHAFWLLNPRTPNFKRIGKGDKVLFYVAGKKGGKFCGSCTLASDPYKVSQEEKILSLGRPSEEFDYIVNLSAIELWENPVLLEDIKDEVSFLKDKEMPRYSFRRSIKIISEEDFLVITHKATKREDNI